MSDTNIKATRTLLAAAAQGPPTTCVRDASTIGGRAACRRHPQLRRAERVRPGDRAFRRRPRHSRPAADAPLVKRAVLQALALLNDYVEPGAETPQLKMGALLGLGLAYLGTARGSRRRGTPLA